MKIAIGHPGSLVIICDGDEAYVDVTTALPSDMIPVRRSGWWQSFCHGFADIRSELERAWKKGRSAPIGETSLASPVPSPSKIIACSINYDAHASEVDDLISLAGGNASPGNEWLHDFDVFLKAPSSIIGTGGTIRLPRRILDAGREIHHESELALVIGRGGKNIHRDHALEHVLGYTLALDVSERAMADRSRRKSYDTFTPVGPWLVTADEIPDPADLEIVLSVNGDIRQQTRTKDMRKSVPEIIEYASSIMTLLPGDLILTGAPPGVGALSTGDSVEMVVEGIGSLRVHADLDAT